MKREFSGGFCVGDVVVIAVLLTAALLLFGIGQVAPASDTVWVQTDHGGESLPLTRNGEYTFTSGGIALVVEIRDGAARVLSSECDSQTCVRSGAISRAGQTVVCAPARFYLKIIRDGGGDADWILP